MDFTLSKQQQMVQKMYKEFAENEVKPLAKKVDAEEYFPMETVEKMAKLGMMGIYFPTEVGGAGGDVLSYVMAVEELSKVCGTTGVIVSAHTSLCAAPIYENGTPEQKAKYLPMLTKGTPWWKVPVRKPHFTIEVRPDIAVEEFCASAASESLAARHVTEHLSEQLFKGPACAST